MTPDWQNGKDVRGRDVSPKRPRGKDGIGRDGSPSRPDDSKRPQLNKIGGFGETALPEDME